MKYISNSASTTSILIRFFLSNPEGAFCSTLPSLPSLPSLLLLSNPHTSFISSPPSLNPRPSRSLLPSASLIPLPIILLLPPHLSLLSPNPTISHVLPPSPSPPHSSSSSFSPSHNPPSHNIAPTHISHDRLKNLQFANCKSNNYLPIKLKYLLTGHLNGEGVYFWST